MFGYNILGLGSEASNANSPGKTNLESWWSLNETSGTRVDSHGSNDLADGNTVLYGTGVRGNAADFETSASEYLSINDNASISVGDIDFTFCGWVKLESDISPNIYGQYDFGNNQRSWKLSYDTTADRFEFRVSNDGIAAVFELADNLGAASLATWYFVVVWHDATANTINIQVNDGTVDSGAHATGVHNSTSPFFMGCQANSGSPAATYYDGLVDEACFFKAVLTSAERTWLYNGGNGRVYSEL